MLKNNKNKVHSFDRLKFVTVVFFIGLFIISAQLFQIEVLQHKYYDAQATGQHAIYKKLTPNRGEIYAIDKDGNLHPIAINRQTNFVVAVPKEIENKKETAQQLASVLDLPEEEILQKISKENDPFEPLKRKVSDETVAALEQLKIKGIEIIVSNGRYYPEKEVFAHLTGYLSTKKEPAVGQYGLEEFFEKDLAGKPGSLIGEKDRQGKLIVLGSTELIAAEDGSNLILTVDYPVQFKAYELIKQAVEKHGAGYGDIVVLDPKSGAIKALAEYPSFDPNDYGKVEDIKVFSNKSVSQAYEPGSVFKVITMAGGLELNLVSPDTTYNDEGFIKFGKYTIKNANDQIYGLQNMTQVLENSINTGAIFVALKMGSLPFKENAEKFGFGSKIGLMLPAEAKGDLSILEKKGEIYTATASYGQGIMATVLQVAQSFGVIANRGMMTKPYLVSELRSAKGKATSLIPSSSHEQVISEKTASLLTAMMISVVKNGHSTNAQVPGYYIAGKTGTAEIAYTDRAGYSAETNHTFAGFAPAENPEFVIVVRLYKPTKGRFADTTCSPTFAEMAKFLLQYYQVPKEYE